MRRGGVVATICMMAGSDALVGTASLRRSSGHRSRAPVGVRLQLFPGNDPYEFVRQAARKRAAEHMVMEEAERGKALSHAFKCAYTEALVDLEVKDAMAGKAGSAWANVAWLTVTHAANSPPLMPADLIRAAPFGP